MWGHSGCSGDAVDAVDAVNVGAKRSTQCTQQIWVVGTVTFSAKRSTPTQ